MPKTNAAAASAVHVMSEALLHGMASLLLAPLLGTESSMAAGGIVIDTRTGNALSKEWPIPL